MSNKKDKMLERVRALLAKAASTNFPEEADAFRAKADELMTAYAIDQWMVADAQAVVDFMRPKPERRDFDFSWWSNNPFRSQLWWMFLAVANHCRCVVVTQKATYYATDERAYKMPVLGIPSDLDWFDLLFTNLMIAMIQKVDPQPRPDLPMEENMAMMREAGLPWADALNRLVRAGIIDGGLDDGWNWNIHDRKTVYFSRAVYERTIRRYRAWCKETGHPQSHVNQRTFRRNFADGFTDEVQGRLYRMRRDSERKYDSEHETGSMAVAVRDIIDVINEEVWTIWPDLRPHPRNCDCDECHRCNDPKCERPRCVAARKPVRTRSTPREKIDHAAREAGRAAGREVNLSNKPSDRLGNTPELPR